MSLVGILVVLLVLGLVWWLLQAYVLPIVPQPFRTLIVVVLVLIVCIWLLNIAGIFGSDLTVPLWRHR
jgi:hypothetical protein